MKDFLNLQVGKLCDDIELTIVNITKTTVRDYNGMEREILKVIGCTDAGVEYRVDEVFLRDHNGHIQPRGLWFILDDDGYINGSSAIADLMYYYEVKTLNELIGRKVFIRALKNRNRYALLAYPHFEE